LGTFEIVSLQNQAIIPMSKFADRIAGAGVVMIFSLIFALAAGAQNQSLAPKESTPSMHAAGSFDVKVTPSDDKSDDPLLGRMVIDKQYHGDLEGTGKGQMLTAGSAVKGSGGYVAIEKVSGTLKGRSGTFVLQHNGSMAGGKFHLNITVVPDSGTGQLAGISGTMNIIIAGDGKHSYEFEYTLPAQ
jgi:hypothetical protein